METTTLGKTGLEVSRLGIGLSEIGYILTRGDEEQAARVLNSALDAGINFLDTAACYGISEELVGKTVSHRRSEFLLATKAGHYVPRGQGEDWTYEVVANSIDRSLRLMNTDYLDLVQLHSCGIDVLERGDVTRALEDARAAGKTRFIGYSGDNDNAEWAVDNGQFDTLQTSFNLVDQGARRKILPAAEAKDMGIIIKRPIANAVWGAAQDPRPYAHLPEYTAEYYRRAGMLRTEGPLPEEPEDRILLAMGFAFGHPEVDVAIIGTKQPEHMLANIELVANRMTIAPEAVEALHDRYDRLEEDWEQCG
jgi:aryl-alcohol dehydrogenase-like predicted oxidoreductase